MAKHTASTLLNGHVSTSSRKMANNSGHGQMRKKNMKTMKSNITNQVKSKRMSSTSVGDVESDDDDGDGLAADDAPTNDDDADVFALSGAQQQNVEDAAQRVAGPDIDEDRKIMIDVNMNDEPQATAGGSEEEFVFGDEDDYAGLDDISDSDEEKSEVGEAGILRSAEQDLIAEFETTESRRVANLMTFEMDMMDLRGAEEAALGLGLLPASVEHSDDVESTVNMNEDPYQGHPVYGDEYHNLWGNAESTLWRMPETYRNHSSDPTQKRVRFEVTPEPTKSSSPSASEDEDPNEAFPDLFTPEDSQIANQGLSGIMADGVFSSQDFNDNESFYDFEDEHEKLAFQIDEQSDSDSDASSCDSDDSGDTTDEETMEESLSKSEERTQAAMKAVEQVRKEAKQEEQSTPATPKTPRRPRNATTPRSASPKSGKGPKMGTFEVDPARAAITTDVDGGKIKILPPSKPLEKDREYWARAKSAISSREGSPRNSFHIVRSVSSDSMPSRPFTAKSTLGSMFNGNLDILRNNDTHGIAEDLFPHVMSRPQSSYSSFDGTDETDTEAHVDMTMEDLVNMDDSDSDAVMQSSAITSPTTPNAFPSLDRDCSDLFDHFEQNRAVIGAFRQNQNLAKQLSSQASHPAQRASTHEYNALQKGRRGAANTPITPARKKRASQDLSARSSGVRKPINSPLAGKKPRSRGNSLAHADLYQTIGRNPFDT